MANVQIVAENEGTASRALAVAAWQAWPRLSPDFWRESLGETVGKIWGDWGGKKEVLGGLSEVEVRLNAGVGEVRVGQGVNGCYAAAYDGPLPNGAVAVVEVGRREGLEAIRAMRGVESVVWRVPDGMAPDDARGMLLALEGMVHEGVVAHYGLAGTHDLAAWLRCAEAAAEDVWGRRKRPALRQVVVRASPYALEALTAARTVHLRHGEEETVSDVELSARLGWRVLVEEAFVWDVPKAGLVEIGLRLGDDAWHAGEALLQHVLQVEERLNARLGGWPQRQGQLAWSALRMVMEGMPLWHTRAVWRRWRADRLPELLDMWQRVEGAATYRALLAELGNEKGEALAVRAEQQVAAALVQPLRQAMGLAWQDADDMAVVAGLMASMPAVHGVLVPAHVLADEVWVRGMQARPDVADVYAILGL